jgi:hypothetical protein
MSLVKKQKITPRKLAANRANAQFSSGPTTPEGREHVRAAHLRHGFYAQAALMLRMEESSFRQMWRLTNLLLGVKGQAQGVAPPRNEGSSRHVL